MSFQLSSPNRRPHKDITRFVNGQTQRKTFLHNYTAFKIRFSFNFISASQPVWPDGQIIFHFMAIEICPKFLKKNAKEDSKFGPKLNIPSNVCIWLLKVCPSFEITPNLVTLFHSFHHVMQWRTIANSVTRLGDFWKVMVTDFLTKVAKTYDDFFDYRGNHHTLVKTTVAPFGQLFGHLGLLFISHWLQV